MKTIAELKTAIMNEKARSAWDRGVNAYAIELLETIELDACDRKGASFEFYGSPADKKMLLSGADSWEQFSEGGCSLVYDYDIAARLCSPSELKKTRDGERNPNSRETWIDCQARALNQACAKIMRLAKA